MIHWSFIYCYWLWLWTILYYLNIVTISPLISLILALVLTTYNLGINSKNKNINIWVRIIIILMELGILYLVMTKSTKITNYDILINILLFSIYLCYITIHKLDIWTIYLTKIPHKLENKNLGEYLLGKLSNP